MMNTTKLVTSFTAHQTVEGMRISYTYSEIDEDGNLVNSNIRKNLVVLDQEVLGHIGDIYGWLNGKLQKLE